MNAAVAGFSTSSQRRLRRPSPMSKLRKKRKPPKRVLALLDLEQAKSAVLNTLTSKSGHARDRTSGDWRDKGALLRALRERWIAGAGLDVAALKRLQAADLLNVSRPFFV